MFVYFGATVMDDKKKLIPNGYGIAVMKKDSKVEFLHGIFTRGK